jgi:hypothetical protein
VVEDHHDGMVIGGETGHRHPVGRAGGQVERPAEQLAAPFPDLLGVQVDHRYERAGRRWFDDLAGQAAIVDEPGPQRLVPIDEGVQRPLQGGQLQVAVDP